MLRRRGERRTMEEVLAKWFSDFLEISSLVLDRLEMKGTPALWWLACINTPS